MVRPSKPSKLSSAAPLATDKPLKPAAPAADGAANADTPRAGKKRRKDRYRAIREIRNAQRNTSARRILPLATTNTWIRSIAANSLNKPDIRFSPEAIQALREVLIAKGTELLKDANDIAALARNSPTVTMKDMKLAEHFDEKGAIRSRVCL
ncbi:MAG: hypothetical protein ACPGR8_06885 [Limisphaerales bacterium]